MAKYDLKTYQGLKLLWLESKDIDFPWFTTHLGMRLTLRMNDYPDEPLYTLYVDGKEVGDVRDESEISNWKFLEDEERFQQKLTEANRKHGTDWKI